MTVNDIEKEIQSKEISGESLKGQRVPGGRFIYISEIYDEHVEGMPYVIRPELVKLFDLAREVNGRPRRISSGYRTRVTQDNLKGTYGKAKFSPHTMGSALDIKTYGEDDARILTQIFYESAETLGIPKPRVGVKKYQGYFIHVDLVFLWFKEFGGEFDYPEDSEPIRINWRPGVSW